MQFILNYLKNISKYLSVDFQFKCIEESTFRTSSLLNVLRLGLYLEFMNLWFIIARFVCFYVAGASVPCHFIKLVDGVDQVFSAFQNI